MSVAKFISSNVEEDILQTFFDQTQDAEAHREVENAAAKTLQASYRRKRENAKHCRHRHFCISIQRVVRGHSGRGKFEFAVANFAREIQMQFYHDQATLIQKIFRGFWCRKSKHNYYIRKAYLHTVMMKGEELRDELRRHEEQTLVEQQSAEKLQREEDFTRLASRLHHLLGTRTTPGVFSSPYNQNAHATVFGLPVETHLRLLGEKRSSTSRRGTAQGEGNKSLSSLSQRRSGGGGSRPVSANETRMERQGSQALGHSLLKAKLNAASGNMNNNSNNNGTNNNKNNNSSIGASKSIMAKR